MPNAFDILKERGFIQQVTHEEPLRDLLAKERYLLHRLRSHRRQPPRGQRPADHGHGPPAAGRPPAHRPPRRRHGHDRRSQRQDARCARC